MKHASTAEDVASVAMLEPKKIPQQERSRRMVQAIIDACETILQHEPEGSLTMLNLEVVSGVGRGSIYQYFPSIDAVVAVLYRRYIRDHIEHWEQRLSVAWPTLDFDAAIAMIMASNLCCHQQLVRLNRGFLQKYSTTFDLNAYYRSIMDNQQASATLFYRLLDQKCPVTYSTASKHMKAELLVANLAATNIYTLQEHPDYFDDPDFAPLLISLTRGILLG